MKDGSKKESSAARCHGLHVAALEVSNARFLDTKFRVGVRNLRPIISGDLHKMRFRGRIGEEQRYRKPRLMDVQEA